jgi:dTDP-glucose 4,6-dehydratase
MKKRILITGGTGFVGHHLVEGVLKQTDWDIVILDCLSYAGTLNRIKTIPERLPDINVWEKNHDRIIFVWHDLRAPISETVSKMIGKVDVIWHLAAESHVDRSLEDAVPFAMSNVVGTTHLLEWIKKENPEAKTIIFSTDEVFGPAPQDVYYKEEDRFRPSNPYSASKAGEEMMAYAFARSFKLPILIVRSMNIYGERQNPEKFIPKTTRAILKGEKMVIHGTPEIGFSSRCWVHAREVCNAMLFLTEKGQTGEFYHIVGEERDVMYLANNISQTVKEAYPEAKLEVDYVDFHQTRPGHDLRYALSGEKLAEMGWQPRLTLEESLKRTVEWTLQNPKWLNL